jgi:Uma2 family endonuclease
MTLHAPIRPDGLETKRFTLEEIERMVAADVFDSLRFEVIDGEIVPMSPQNMPHMSVISGLVQKFAISLRPPLKCWPNATLRLGEAPATLLEPDILIGRVPKSASAITPDMVDLLVEVAHTTRDKDLNIKAPRYAAAGVPELWVVDIAYGVTRVHRRPSPEGWGSIEAIAFDADLRPLCAPDLIVNIAALLDD